MIDRGLIEIVTEGEWKPRLAREFRLTFVSTTSNQKHVAATEEYRKWSPTQKSSVEDVSTEYPTSVDDVSTVAQSAVEDVSTKIATYRRKTAVSGKAAVEYGSTHIVKPYPPAQLNGAKGEDGVAAEPETPAGDRFDTATADRLAVEVRGKLEQHRQRQGLLGVRNLARDAGVDPQRLIAFIDRRDLLTAPTIARINREIGKAA